MTNIKNTKGTFEPSMCWRVLYGGKTQYTLPQDSRALNTTAYFISDIIYSSEVRTELDLQQLINETP